MSKSELRIVEYSENQYTEDNGGFLERKSVTCKGYFHRWFESKDYIDGFQVSNLYAVIESDSGEIKYMEPTKIKFR